MPTSKQKNAVEIKTIAVNSKAKCEEMSQKPSVAKPQDTKGVQSITQFFKNQKAKTHFPMIKPTDQRDPL